MSRDDKQDIALLSVALLALIGILITQHCKPLPIHWLRDGKGKTGFSVRFTISGEYGEVGFRWTKRVFNAPPGPWLHWAPTNLQLDAGLISWQRLKAKVGR